MLREMLLPLKTALFDELRIKPTLETKKSYFFSRKLRSFQYFEILSKSDLLEMKQNLCIA